MRYLPFSKYKYYIKDKTEDLTTALEKEYQARLNGYTSQKTLLSPPLLNYRDGTQTSKYPIFYLPLPKIQNLADQFRRNSNEIKTI